MPRAASETSPAKRIEALERSRKRAKSELKRGETLTAKPMAGLLGVSWTILRKWCETLDGFAESGAFDFGSEGVEWVFRPLKTIDWLISHFKREHAARAERARRERKIIAGSSLNHLPDDIGLDDLRKMLDVQERVDDGKIRQGALTDANLAAAQFRRYHDEMQKSLLRAGQTLDPTNGWDPVFRQQFDQAMRDTLLMTQRISRECLSNLRSGKN